jgi:DNA-binding MarR family transcriptional regulator
MADTVAELHGTGHVARQSDPTDRRKILITLTERGLAELRADRLRRQGWLAEAISSQLTPDEQDVLAQAIPLLDRLAES